MFFRFSLSPSLRRLPVVSSVNIRVNWIHWIIREETFCSTFSQQRVRKAMILSLFTWRIVSRSLSLSHSHGVLCCHPLYDASLCNISPLAIVVDISCTPFDVLMSLSFYILALSHFLCERKGTRGESAIHFFLLFLVSPYAQSHREGERERQGACNSCFFSLVADQMTSTSWV